VAAALPSAGKKRLDALIARRFPTVAPDQPKQTMKDRPISDPFVVQNLRQVYEPIKGLTGIEMGGVFLKMNDGSLRHESGGPGAWSTAMRSIIADALVKWGDRNNPPYYVDVLCTYHTHPGDKDTAGSSRMAPSGTDVQTVTKSMYQGSSIFGKEHYVITPFSVYAITPGGGVEALGSTETLLGVKPSPELVKPKTALEYPLP
jgi:hypothetical protein